MFLLAYGKFTDSDGNRLTASIGGKVESLLLLIGAVLFIGLYIYEIIFYIRTSSTFTGIVIEEVRRIAQIQTN